jgi:hypothetical protein
MRSQSISESILSNGADEGEMLTEVVAVARTTAICRLTKCQGGDGQLPRGESINVESGIGDGEDCFGLARAECDRASKDCWSNSEEGSGDECGEALHCC